MGRHGIVAIIEAAAKTIVVITVIGGALTLQPSTRSYMLLRSPQTKKY